MADLQCSQCKQWKGIRDFRSTGSKGGVLNYADTCIECEDPLDADVSYMDHATLIDEVKRLRRGIRSHRDATGHNLCWWVPELWNLLPEKVAPKPEIPPREEFLHHCALYRDSLK